MTIAHVFDWQADLQPTGTYTVRYNSRGVADSTYPNCAGGCGRNLGRLDGSFRVTAARDGNTGEYLKRMGCRCGAINLLRYHNGGRVDWQRRPAG